MLENNPPRWDLSNVYPGLDSFLFLEDMENLERQVRLLNSFFEKEILNLEEPYNLETVAITIGEYITLLNDSQELYGKVRAYINSFIKSVI